MQSPPWKPLSIFLCICNSIWTPDPSLQSLHDLALPASPNTCPICLLLVLSASVVYSLVLAGILLGALHLPWTQPGAVPLHVHRAGSFSSSRLCPKDTSSEGFAWPLHPLRLPISVVSLLISPNTNSNLVFHLLIVHLLSDFPMRYKCHMGRDCLTFFF